MRGNQAQKNNRRKRRKLKSKEIYVIGRGGQAFVQREVSVLWANAQFVGCDTHQVKGKT